MFSPRGRTTMAFVASWMRSSSSLETSRTTRASSGFSPTVEASEQSCSGFAYRDLPCSRLEAGTRVFRRRSMAATMQRPSVPADPRMPKDPSRECRKPWKYRIPTKKLLPICPAMRGLLSACRLKSCASKNRRRSPSRTTRTRARPPRTQAAGIESAPGLSDGVAVAGCHSWLEGAAHSHRAQVLI